MLNKKENDKEMKPVSSLGNRCGCGCLDLSTMNKMGQKLENNKNFNNAP